jgi:tetratricopeptide (TPR) repeat protein
MNKFNAFVIASLLLSGCAQLPTPAAPVQRAVTPEPAVPPAPAVSAPPVLPDIELSDDLLYEILLTEFAHQRGYKTLAVGSSAEVAKKTRDPRLAKRAAQLALESGDMKRAVAAFRFWEEVDPTALMATRMLSSLLLRGGKLDEARLEFVKVLKSDEPNEGLTFLQIYPMLVNYPDKSAVLQLMRDLSLPYPRVSEAHWVVAKLAQAAGDEMLALNEVRVARSLRPEWHPPVALEAQLLQKSAPEQGLALLRHYLSVYPDVGEIRLQYARALLEQKQYKQAQDEFLYLSRASPENVELAFAVALISLQLNDLPGAEAELRQALDKGGKGNEAMEYFLGQLNEAKENEQEALIHYREVKSGEYQFAAQLRVVYLLSKQGKLEEARSTLHLAQATTPVQQVQLALIEVQLLRQARKLPEAYQVLLQGLAKLPDNTELLYEAAMLGDTLGHYAESEKQLRRLIQIKPDYAHAYNALGYSMLVRNVHINEAVQLVEKALQLAPDDYAIMDSVGWGYYRSGRLDDSLNMLRKAYAGNPDPEIAAHLGEVLWAHGDKDDALNLLQQSLEAHPDNEPLKAVMKRLQP